MAQANDIYHMVEGDLPDHFVMRFTFSVVSFYNGSDAESTKIDGYMDGAQKYLNKQIEDKNWA